MSVDYLELTDLTVSFDGFVAVDSVNLSVLPGDLRFLIGPNGAGKTTLIDAVTGLVRATGSVRSAGMSWWARRCTGSPGSASGARSRPRRCSRS